MGIRRANYEVRRRTDGRGGVPLRSVVAGRRSPKGRRGPSFLASAGGQAGVRRQCGILGSVYRAAIGTLVSRRLPSRHHPAANVPTWTISCGSGAVSMISTKEAIRECVVGVMEGDGRFLQTRRGASPEWRAGASGRLTDCTGFLPLPEDDHMLTGGEVTFCDVGESRPGPEPPRLVGTWLRTTILRQPAAGQVTVTA